MRHLKKVKKIGLAKDHRKSLLKNLIASLVLAEHLCTTQARAKALAARFGKLMWLIQNKEKREALRLLPNYCANAANGTAYFKLINELKSKYDKRTSGFTRITRLAMRKGDNALLVRIELI